MLDTQLQSPETVSKLWTLYLSSKSDASPPPVTMGKTHGKKYQNHFRVTSYLTSRRNKEKRLIIDTEASMIQSRKNDGFWLLLGIFSEYNKQNIIMATLRNTKRKTDSNFNFVQAAKLLIRFNEEEM